MAEHPLAAADGGNLGDGEDHAGLVVRHHHGDDGGVGPDGFLEQMHVERSVALHGQIGDIVALLLEELAEVDVRRVLHFGRDDVLLTGIHEQRTVDGAVVRFGAAAREDDLLGVGIDERGDFLPRLLDMSMHLRTERVGTGGVAPKLAQHRNHRVGHFRRDLCRGVVIEVKYLARSDHLLLRSENHLLQRVVFQSSCKSYILIWRKSLAL